MKIFDLNWLTLIYLAVQNSLQVRVNWGRKRENSILSPLNSLSIIRIKIKAVTPAGHKRYQQSNRQTDMSVLHTETVN